MTLSQLVQKTPEEIKAICCAWSRGRLGKNSGFLDADNIKFSEKGIEYQPLCSMAGFYQSWLIPLEFCEIPLSEIEIAASSLREKENEERDMTEKLKKEIVSSDSFYKLNSILAKSGGYASICVSYQPPRI